MNMRERIIAEARSWIGTRWHHQGRIKKNEQFHGGIDCAGLIIEVGNNLGLFSKTLIFHSYHRLPQNNLVIKECNRYFIKKPITKILPGDILVFRIMSEPQHLAILSETHSIIHAYVQSKNVVEHSFDMTWQEKLMAVYSYPGV